MEHLTREQLTYDGIVDSFWIVLSMEEDANKLYALIEEMSENARKAGFTVLQIAEAYEEALRG